MDIESLIPQLLAAANAYPYRREREAAFRRVLLTGTHVPPSQAVELLPREHRTTQAQGFAMIAPTDWIETTVRWHARCEAHRRATEYRQTMIGARGRCDELFCKQAARDCIEWIEHQTEMHILRVIADALDVSWPDTADTVDTYKRRITFHVGARYA